MASVRLCNIVLKNKFGCRDLLEEPSGSVVGLGQGTVQTVFDGRSHCMSAKEMPAPGDSPGSAFVPTLPCLDFWIPVPPLS